MTTKAYDNLNRFQRVSSSPSAPTSTQHSTNFAAFEANENIAALVNTSNAVASAHYEYGPFGEPLRATGPMAEANPFRYSTKYQDEETDFLYYGYRYFNPSTGRWLSRDPAEERGGLSLYGFVLNNSVSRFDIRGLSVDPNSIVGPDIAEGISRAGPVFVNSLLFNNARNPLFPYEKVRKNGMPQTISR
jgi:RHS repeat-associated protein